MDQNVFEGCILELSYRRCGNFITQFTVISNGEIKVEKIFQMLVNHYEGAEKKRRYKRQNRMKRHILTAVTGNFFLSPSQQFRKFEHHKPHKMTSESEVI